MKVSDLFETGSEATHGGRLAIGRKFKNADGDKLTVIDTGTRNGQYVVDINGDGALIWGKEILTNWSPLKESADETLYHVTLTKHLDKIKKKGILPLQTSNWVQAGSKERYGKGEIFAFTSLKDAKRWALKWDWDVSKSMGSGKISIITFTDDASKWKVDEADPIGQAMNAGKWLKKDGHVPPDQIKSAEPVTSDIAKQMVIK